MSKQFNISVCNNSTEPKGCRQHLVVSVSASGAVGVELCLGCAILKVIKMLLAASLLMLATKGSARKTQEGRLLKHFCQVAVKALQSYRVYVVCFKKS